MGEGDWCFALCELHGDNAGTPELIKNYCSGAAGFAKRRQVFTELLWTSCSSFICNYMLVFLSTSSERCIKIPLPWYKSVLTGSGMLEGIWMTSGSNDSESCYWKYGSVAAPRIKFSNRPTQPKNLSQCGGRAHPPTNRRHTSHMSFFFYVFNLIWMKV